MKRRCLSCSRGVIATETAFLIPVVLVGIMMFMELARIVLTVGIGNTALNGAVHSLRQETGLTPDTVKELVAERMVEQGFSYGYLLPGDVEVAVEHFDSLEALGGKESTAQTGEPQEDDIRPSLSRPVWIITVDVRKPYITPLPTFLTLENVFRYRFKQVLGYLEQDEQAAQGQP